MPIKESDSEKRNLTVTSLAFIAYYYAGGSFSADSSVRLQVINMEFSKPEILACMAWFLFGWFIYRYWVTRRGAFKAAFIPEFKEWQGKDYIDNYVHNALNHEIQINGDCEEYNAENLYWHKGCVVIKCIYRKVHRKKGKKTSVKGDTAKKGEPNKEIKLTGIKGWLLAFWATISCIFTKPSFFSYFAPYILAMGALFGPVYRLF